MKLNKELRERHNLKQEDVAKELKVDRSTVTKWETGDALPRAGMLPDLARVLNCRMDELFCD